jgi:hypothetical protein
VEKRTGAGSHRRILRGGGLAAIAAGQARAFVIELWRGGRQELGRRTARKLRCLTVEYFFYCRGRPGTEALADELAEAHWSFMDGDAAAMIVRGRR